jgi:hypothetical protein
MKNKDRTISKESIPTVNRATYSPYKMLTIMLAQASFMTSAWKQNEWDKRILPGQKLSRFSKKGPGKRDRVARATMPMPILMMTLFVRMAA